MNLHIKKNDNVLVLSGKDKGKRGKVLRVDRETRRAIVEKVNMIKRHTRANPALSIKGGIAEREAPLHLSKLMVVCNQCNTPARFRQQRLENGKGVRKCARCGGTAE